MCSCCVCSVCCGIVAVFGLSEFTETLDTLKHLNQKRGDELVRNMKDAVIKLLSVQKHFFVTQP